MPEDEINPFPELPPSSPDKASTQLGQSSPPHTTFSAPDRLAFARNTTPSRATPCVSPAFSPGGTPRPAISRIDTSSRESLQTPPQNLSFGSGAWSTVATPGLAENDDEERHFDIGPSAPPLTPPLRPTSANGKNVRFMGPDGAPLSPATTHMTVDSYDAPPGPPPSSFESPRTSPKLPSASIPPPQPRPRDDSSSSNQSRSAINGTASVGTRLNGNAPHRPRVDSATTRPSNSANAAVPPPPPPSLVSYPSHPPPVAQSYGLGLISPSTASGSAAPTRKQIDESQKHAKWAISALDFDDIETARAELRKALATIGG